MKIGSLNVITELTFSLVRFQVLGNTVLSRISVGDKAVCKAIENFTKLIPVGKYKMVFYMSPRNKLVFLLLNVTGRKYIEIHTANYYYQLNGCVAPCSSFSGAMGVNSRKALDLMFAMVKDCDTMYLEVSEDYKPFLPNIDSSVLV